MNKKNIKWQIKDLQKKFDIIEFPEYQREPTVWDLDRKQKLIDSILRNFDISNIYLYKRHDGNYECIDGRQRINAITSFLGLNEGKEEDPSDRYHNKFSFKSSDELLGVEYLKDFDNKTWNKLKKDQQERILNYVFNIIEITDIDKDEELNLMFLRLQLGAALNAGEKLKAMVGDMRDFIFKKIGDHPYFDYLKIPKRRFSKQLTASQIAINFFSLHERKEYKRARFVDLQLFYKDYSQFTPRHKELANKLAKRLDEVFEYLEERKVTLKNRAIAISTFFFISDLIEKNQKDKIPAFLKFLRLFLVRLKEQVEKGINIDRKYRDLLKFQTYISQAAVEKYAIENRQTFLEEYFVFYLKRKKIKGDS